MPSLDSLRAWEILDSRGRPTIKVSCRLSDGSQAAASVPSGASTGEAEALELRDGDAQRYRALGCLNAARNVNETVHDALTGQTFDSQEQFDRALLELDGTPNKSKLGANAILGCSLAFARAMSVQKGEPLYQTFSRIIGREAHRLPQLSVNLLSGGKHAGGQVPIQDVLIVPCADSVEESLRWTSEVYLCAAELCAERYQMRLLTADEGGLAPPCTNCEEMFELAMNAIEKAGLVGQVKLATDVASSHFEENGNYHLDGAELSGPQMVERLQRWIADYDLVSVEDGLAEEDWPHWQTLMEATSDDVCIVGDDLLCTNPARIERAIELSAANTLLLKVNQIGTLTEAAQAYRLAKKAGWKVVISARSGETEDDWLADLAVGWNGDFIKVGSITQSERLAKYNRLLEIEQETGWRIG